jgi:hypothetical protein
MILEMFGCLSRLARRLREQRSERREFRFIIDIYRCNCGVKSREDSAD